MFYQDKLERKLEEFYQIFSRDFSDLILQMLAMNPKDRIKLDELQEATERIIIREKVQSQQASVRYQNEKLVQSIFYSKMNKSSMMQKESHNVSKMLDNHVTEIHKETFENESIPASFI